MIMGIIVVAGLIITGVVILVNAVFRWDSYSQNFPPEYYPRWKVNTTKYIYETYGIKAVRKYLLFLSFVLIVLGIWMFTLMTKDVTERVEVADFPEVWEGDTVSFAGGTLSIDAIGYTDGFTAKRYNIDKNMYEDVEVEADMHGENLLLVMTTLTNSGSDTLSIVQEDLKIYAKPVEGNNLNGRVAVDGYLYHDNAIELAAGESVPVWFWLSVTDEEVEGLYYFLVLQYGSTGCQLTAHG